MENEIAVVSDIKYDLAMARDPNQVLAEAMNAAKALQSIIKQKAKPVVFGGKKYVEFEDWQVLGRFYGVTAKIVSTDYIDIGGTKGFLARAEAIDSTGRVISAAEAMCLNDEDKWSARAKYEYPNGVKTKTGEIPVPLFQLRSMAQTRACAKSLRNVLAWVVVMAGYEPTVAEEMTGDEGGHEPTSAPIKPPVAKAPASTTSAAPAGGLELVPSSLETKPGEKDGKAFVRYSIKLPDGAYASTFDENMGFTLQEAKGAGVKVRIFTIKKGQYTNITKVENI